MIDFDLTPENDPSRPRCAPGIAALQRLLDGDATWDTAEAATHRAICVDCREELTLSRSLMQMPDPFVVPSDMANRVVHGAIRSRRQRNVLQRAGVVLALAASVIIVVVLARPTQHVESIPVTGARVPSKGPELAKKPLGESVTEARDAIVSLTKRTASETRDRSAQLMPNAKLPDALNADDRLDALADARNGASKSVEPIRDSARRAFNFILRAADPPSRVNAQ